MSKELADRLEACRDALYYDGHFTAATLIDEAIAALRSEPVAWMTFDGEGSYDLRLFEDNENYKEEWDKRNPKHIGWVQPLYAAPSTVQSAWIPVGEMLPEDEKVVITYTPPSHDGDEVFGFDSIFEGCWYNHEENYQHFRAVAGKGCCMTGPSSKAPERINRLCDMALFSPTARGKFAKEKAALSQQWLDWGVKRRDEGIEAAAKVCEQLRKEWVESPSLDEYDKPTAIECIQAIRKLKGASHD